MNTNQKIKIRVVFSLIVLAIVFINITISSVSAAGPRSTYYGQVNGVKVVAQKDVALVSANSWNGYIWSHTQLSWQSIGTIGWYWWKIEEICGSQVITQYNYSGQALIPGSAISDIAVDTLNFCSDPSRQYGLTGGMHDFKNGSDTWSPVWSHLERIQ